MATQETIKQLFSGGVLRDIEDVDARQAITALQNALNVLTSGDTTTAIENFQEVIDFLDGVTDDETLIGKITALQTAINGKQPILTFDNAPTSGSNNPVKSGGVRTALDAKVDKETGKGLSSNDYTTAEKTKLAGLPTGSELTTALGNKANAADVYTKAQTDAAIQEVVEDIEAGDSIVFDTDGTPIADGALSQNADSVLAAASARWVKEIDNNVKAILAALANIAFTNGKPSWAAVSKRKYNLTLSLSGCTGEIVSGDADNSQVYEGGVRVKLTPTTGYTFTSVKVNGNDVVTTPTGLGDGSVYVDFIANQIMTVAATAVSGFAIAVSGSHVTNSQSHSGSTYTVTLGSDNQHFHLPVTIVVKHGSTVLTAGTDYTYNQSTGVVVISNVEDNTYSIEVTMVEDTKYTVSVDATGLTGATATPASQQVYEGEDAVITIQPSESGYTLNEVKYAIGSGSEQTATISDNQAIITISNVQANTSVVITGSASVPSVDIQHTETNCSLTMPQDTIGVGDTVTIPITVAEGYGINDAVKAACISVKDADTDTDIPFTIDEDVTVAQNSFDSKIDVTLEFTASCQNISISINPAILLLKDKALSQTGAISASSGYCVLAPKFHLKGGTPFVSGDYVFYKFANSSKTAMMVFYKSGGGIMDYCGQAGNQSGLKTYGMTVTSDASDLVRAMFYTQDIARCYVQFNHGNTAPSDKVLDFSTMPYIIFDTSNS